MFLNYSIYPIIKSRAVYALLAQVNLDRVDEFETIQSLTVITQVEKKSERHTKHEFPYKNYFIKSIYLQLSHIYLVGIIGLLSLYV